MGHLLCAASRLALGPHSPLMCPPRPRSKCSHGERLSIDYTIVLSSNGSARNLNPSRLDWTLLWTTLYSPTLVLLNNSAGQSFPTFTGATYAPATHFIPLTAPEAGNRTDLVYRWGDETQNQWTNLFTELRRRNSKPDPSVSDCWVASDGRSLITEFGGSECGETEAQGRRASRGSPRASGRGQEALPGRRWD